MHKTLQEEPDPHTFQTVKTRWYVKLKTDENKKTV